MIDSHPGPATIDDVAKAAGVSTATVSRALRNHPYVADATRAKVMEAAARLRYVANPNAARLASGATSTVGLLAPVLTSWYTSEVVAGVEEVFAEAGYDLLIGTADPKARDRMLSGETRFRQRVDGVILVDVMCREVGARQLAALDVPVVVLGEELHAVDSVSVDNVAGAAMAARHLIELGHRRIGVVGGHSYAEDEHDVPNDRTNGFRSALATEDIELPDASVCDGGFTIDGGRRAMHALMELPHPPTGVFAMSDEMGFGVLQALRERGLVPGRDVSVIGFDDHPVAEAMGLTTVRQPVRVIGRFGAQVLLERLEGIGTAHHREMPLSLVVRASTGVPHSAS
ncbi:MAG: LacI family DNA-binding transcriptional regulator [Actinobacteria bacterium]|nr:LacI family DNA-binding transcriptional regulator [Actinomycetota bacterium]